MAFAEIAELEDYLGRELTEAEERQADLALELATGVIRSYTGQQIEAGTTVETFRLADSFILRQFPVTAITEVDVDGEIKDPATYVFDTSGVLRWADWYHAPAWVASPSIVTVTYEHGYAVVPADVRAVCLAMAARGVGDTNSGRVLEERIGTYAVRYDNEGSVEGVGLTATERRLLAPYTNLAAA